VQSALITASDPADSEAYFEPSDSKVYRHPTFYDLPGGIEHM